MKKLLVLLLHKAALDAQAGVCKFLPNIVPQFACPNPLQALGKKALDALLASLEHREGVSTGVDKYTFMRGELLPVELKKEPTETSLLKVKVRESGPTSAS